MIRDWAVCLCMCLFSHTNVCLRAHGWMYAIFSMITFHRYVPKTIEIPSNGMSKGKYKFVIWKSTKKAMKRNAMIDYCLMMVAANDFFYCFHFVYLPSPVPLIPSMSIKNVNGKEKIASIYTHRKELFLLLKAFSVFRCVSWLIKLCEMPNVGDDDDGDHIWVNKRIYTNNM